MNLLLNAATAIGGRGTITIGTGRDDGSVWVEIKDTGCGIAANSLNRIFDPFFTTKPVGQGVGLGLSLAYGIVQRHHGRFDVASTLGQGSAFRVWLPLRQPTPVG
jgi:signal transduction histidine kinase